MRGANAFNGNDCCRAHHVCARRCAKADRSLRKNGHTVADADTARLRSAESRRHDVRTHQHLLVAKAVRDRREVRHRIGNEQIFGLGAIDRIAEAPATHCLPPAAFVSAALRMEPAQRSIGCPRRRYGSGDHALPFPIAENRRSKLLDNAYRFVAYRQSFGDGVLAFQNVHVGTADGRGGYTDQRVEGPDVGDGLFIQNDAAWLNEYCGSHHHHAYSPFPEPAANVGR